MSRPDVDPRDKHPLHREWSFSVEGGPATGGIWVVAELRVLRFHAWHRDPREGDKTSHPREGAMINHDLRRPVYRLRERYERWVRTGAPVVTRYGTAIWPSTTRPATEDERAEVAALVQHYEGASRER